MYEFSSIFIYFLSIIIVISAMTFVVLMTIVHEVSHRRHLLSLMAFCACNFLLQLLYLGMTVQDILIRYYRYSVYLRVADIVLYTFQSYLWCRYLLFYPLKHSWMAKHCKTVCNAVAAVTLVVGVFNYACNVDNAFLYKNVSAITLELICTVLISIMIILTLASLKRGFNERFDTYNIAISILLIFIQWSTDISLILETEVGFSFSAHEYLTGSLQQILLALMLALYVYRTDYSGATLRERLSTIINAKQPVTAADIHANAARRAVGADGNAASHADTQPDTDKCLHAAYSIDSIDEDTVTAAHVETHAEADLDFTNDTKQTTSIDNPNADASESDRHTQGNIVFAAIGSSADPEAEAVADFGSGSDSETDFSSDDSIDIDPIDRLFEQCQLTPREREVARLAYTGLTNPEIADKLCISQYTVKRHMHAVFEKLGISAHIELVHLLSGH